VRIVVRIIVRRRAPRKPLELAKRLSLGLSAPMRHLIGRAARRANRSVAIARLSSTR